MKAITFSEFGGPEVLTISDLPDPVPGPGEVLIKVAASTVNPTDLLMRSGAQAGMMTDLTPPYIAGMEFSGTILDSNGSNFEVGTPVIGVLNPRTPRGGSYTEKLVVSADAVAPIGDNVDVAAASTVPMNALTALLSLDFLNLEKGQSLLVTGGAGMLGGAAIQLAKAAGITVLANVAEKDKQLVKDLGADHILPRNDGLEEAVRTLFPNGVDGMIDGAMIGQQISHLVKDGGGCVSLRGTYKIDDARLQVLNVSVLKGMNDSAAIHKIAALLTSGALVARVAKTYPYTEAVQAHEDTEAGAQRGRAVLVF